MPFKKGQSGNPKGRKKEDLNIRMECQAMTPEIMTLLKKCLRGKDLKIAMMAANMLLNRAYGMPSQDLQLTGEITVNVNLIPK